jgi:P27 family predicted phage terminase small subunit
MGGKGSGGKNRKPTEQKIAEGNRGRREINEAAPPSHPGEPKMPSFLTNPAAKKLWPEIVEILADNDVLFKTDGIAIAALCSSIALFQQADAAIAKFGSLHSTVDEETGIGELRTAPAVRVRSDALKHMRACWQAFGLDPVSRSGIQVMDKPPKAGEDTAQPRGAIEKILHAKSAKDEIVH